MHYRLLASKKNQVSATLVLFFYLVRTFWYIGCFIYATSNEAIAQK